MVVWWGEGLFSGGMVWGGAVLWWCGVGRGCLVVVWWGEGLFGGGVVGGGAVWW